MYDLYRGQSCKNCSAGRIYDPQIEQHCSTTLIRSFLSVPRVRCDSIPVNPYLRSFRHDKPHILRISQVLNIEPQTASFLFAATQHMPLANLHSTSYNREIYPVLNSPIPHIRKPQLHGPDIDANERISLNNQPQKKVDHS